MKRNIEALDKHLTQLKTNLNKGYYGGACFLIREALHELDIIKAKANGLERSSDKCHIQNVSNSMPDFGFAEWCGRNYIRMNKVWCHRYVDQRDEKNWKTSEQLYKLYNEGIDC